MRGRWSIIAMRHYRTPLRDRRFVDSLLEGYGFELSVPREMGTVSRLRFVTFLEIPMDSDVITVVLQMRPPHA